jgi:hypothetical protein
VSTSPRFLVTTSASHTGPLVEQTTASRRSGRGARFPLPGSLALSLQGPLSVLFKHKGALDDDMPKAAARVVVTLRHHRDPVEPSIVSAAGTAESVRARTLCRPFPARPPPTQPSIHSAIHPSIMIECVDLRPQTAGQMPLHELVGTPVLAAMKVEPSAR